MLFLVFLRARLNVLVLGYSLSLLGLCSGCDPLSPAPEPELTDADLSALEALADCDVFRSRLGLSLSGELYPSDCTFGSIQGVSVLGDPLGARVQYIGFRIDDEQIPVRITMTSAAVDSYLALWRKDGTRVGTGADNAGGVDARIELPLRAGTYLLAASASRPEELGRYSVLIERAP